MTARALHVVAARPALVVAALTVMALAVLAHGRGWDRLWASADQRGRFLFAHDRYAEAAEAFADPMWRGVAQMRAKDFKAAAQSFSAVLSADGAYDQGNALVMIGKYADAVAAYDRALSLRPGWAEATVNRTIAQVRAERMKATGGDLGDQREGADEVVYDKDAKQPEGQETQDRGAASMSDEAIRSLWLKRLDARPAEFLRARFSYQLQSPSQGAVPQ